eukprot:Hpha_TRINITY_DN18856_c0_g1::TRINITY_DN18856_c0_g1_i1::g.26258::m.26258
MSKVLTEWSRPLRKALTFESIHQGKEKRKVVQAGYEQQLPKLQGLWRTSEDSAAIVRGTRVDHFNRETGRHWTQFITRPEGELQLAEVKDFSALRDHMDLSDLSLLKPGTALVSLDLAQVKWIHLDSEEESTWFYIGPMPSNLGIPDGVQKPEPVAAKPAEPRLLGGNLQVADWDRGAGRNKEYVGAVGGRGPSDDSAKPPDDNEKPPDDNAKPTPSWVDVLVQPRSSDDTAGKLSKKPKKVRIYDIPDDNFVTIKNNDKKKE